MHIFEKIAPSALHSGIVIAALDALEGETSGEGAEGGAIVLHAVAIVFAALALLITRERRRTLFWLGTDVAATCVIGLIGRCQPGIFSARPTSCVRSAVPTGLSRRRRRL